MTETTIEPQLNGEKLIFLTGAARSGTTYLQKLLASHPQVKTGPESHLFSLYIDPLLKAWQYQVDAAIKDTRSGLGMPSYMDEEQYFASLDIFLSQLLQPMLEQLQENERFLEKSPSHVNSLPAIHKLLPQAKIIHIIRDPRDVVASVLAASRSWGKNWAVDSAKIAAYTWCKQMNNVEAFAKTLDPSIFFEIRYEDLTADPMKSLQEIGEFLELTWSTAELEEAIASNSLQASRKTGGTAIPVGGLIAESRGKVLQEPTGFVRKGKPGSWKTDLTVFEKLIVWVMAKSTMEKFGYSWQFPWLSQ